MTMMDSDDLQRLWSLIEDLTNQLSANRQLCESLQAQADQLKGQALHSGTGYALRRFNLDLSKEKFESELEALNAYLVKENQNLAHENKQQALLLKEYENTLETIMAKFRSFSHSTQQHTLRLTAHYESLVATTNQNAVEQTLAAETTFSGTLTHLGELVRKAVRAMDGEESSSEDEDEHRGGRETAELTLLRPTTNRHALKARQSGWSAEPRWYGSGGYTGKDMDAESERAEKALERLTEEERLRIENETLRELLGLKERSDALLLPYRDAPANIATAPIHATATTITATTTTTATTATIATTTATTTTAPTVDVASDMPVKETSELPVKSQSSLAVDQTAIETEASGQPPSKSLKISETILPVPAKLSAPVATTAPLEPQELMVQQASKADLEEPNLDKTEVKVEQTSREESADTAVKVEKEQDDSGPNLVAEPSPPALLTSGITESDKTGNTTVSLISAVEPVDCFSAEPSSAETRTDEKPSTSQPSPTNQPFPPSSKPKHVVVVTEEEAEASGSAQPTKPHDGVEPKPHDETKSKSHDEAESTLCEPTTTADSSPPSTPPSSSPPSSPLSPPSSSSSSSSIPLATSPKAATTEHPSETLKELQS